MIHIAFFLEERSAEELIQQLMPRLAPEITFKCIPFEGKQDLEKNLTKRIRGYQIPNSYFIVLRDQDSGNCFKIKEKLTGLCEAAGRPSAIIRIACRELESWYLADLKAVEEGMHLPGISRFQQNKKFRNPDYLGSPLGRIKKTNKRAISKDVGFKSNCILSRPVKYPVK